MENSTEKFTFESSGADDAYTLLLSLKPDVQSGHLSALMNYLLREANVFRFSPTVTNLTGKLDRDKGEKVTNYQIPENLDTRSLVEMVSESAEAYAFNASKIIAVGFFGSGGFIIDLLARHPYFLAGALLFRPTITAGELVARPWLNTPIFISTHITDLQTFKLHKELKRTGFDVHLEQITGDEEMMIDDFRLAAQWIFQTFG